jgi:hypothetical protein
MVSIASVTLAGFLGFEFEHRQKIFLFSEKSRQALASSHLLLSGTSVLSLE